MFSSAGVAVPSPAGLGKGRAGGIRKEAPLSPAANRSHHHPAATTAGVGTAAGARAVVADTDSADAGAGGALGDAILQLMGDLDMDGAAEFDGSTPRRRAAPVEDIYGTAKDFAGGGAIRQLTHVKANLDLPFDTPFDVGVDGAAGLGGTTGGSTGTGTGTGTAGAV